MASGNIGNKLTFNIKAVLNDIKMLSSPSDIITVACWLLNFKSGDLAPLVAVH